MNIQIPDKAVRVFVNYSLFFAGIVFAYMMLFSGSNNSLLHGIMYAILGGILGGIIGIVLMGR